MQCRYSFFKYSSQIAMYTLILAEVRVFQLLFIVSFLCNEDFYLIKIVLNESFKTKKKCNLNFSQIYTITRKPQYQLTPLFQQQVFKFVTLKLSKVIYWVQAFARANHLRRDNSCDVWNQILSAILEQLSTSEKSV